MECSICIEIQLIFLSYKRLQLSLRASRQLKVVRIEKIGFLTFSEWLRLRGLHVDEIFYNTSVRGSCLLSSFTFSTRVANSSRRCRLVNHFFSYWISTFLQVILEDEYPPDLFFGFRFWDIRIGRGRGGV